MRTQKRKLANQVKSKTRRQRIMASEIDELRKTDEYKKAADKASRKQLIDRVKNRFFPNRQRRSSF